MIRSPGNKIGLLLVLLQLHAGAQSFRWKSNLDTVPTTGFYTIPLSVDWLLRVKTDLSDVRIRDEKDHTVPFLINTSTLEKGSSFIRFPILKNATDSVSTRIDMDLSKRDGADHLLLVIANNAVERFTSLSGSNDGQQWFIIEEQLRLTNNGSDASGHFVQQLNFPFTRYRFLRLVINNHGSYPLQILDAGQFIHSNSSESPQFYTHEGTRWQQKDSSDGNSYVFIYNPQSWPVDRILTPITAPKFYSRLVEAFGIGNDGTKNILGSMTLRPGEDAALRTKTEKAREFLLVIKNGDNPPLRVNAIQTQSRVQQLVAWLEKGKQYALLGGNDSLDFANYDLALFRDSIPNQAPVLRHGMVMANLTAIAASRVNDNWWIWPSIIAALLVLVLLTFRLLADMKKAKL